VLPIIMDRDGSIGFYLSNDGPAPINAEIVFGQGRLSGETLWSKQREARVGPMTTVQVHTADRSTLKTNPDEYLFIRCSVSGKALPTVIYFANGWADVPWPTPHVTVNAEADRDVGNELWRVTVHTDFFARLLHLIVPETAGAYTLSDNYFDLPAGEPREVRLSTERPVSPKDLRIGHWLTSWR
jgi:hypothetical protein